MLDSVSLRGFCVQAPVLRDIAASALLAMRFSARVPRWPGRWVKSTEIQQVTKQVATTRRSTPFFAGVDLQFYGGLKSSKIIMGIIWVLGVLYVLGKKRKKLVQSFKKGPKRPLVFDKTLDFWRAANYLLFLNMWICAFFFWCFYQNWMPCWSPQDGL